MPPPLYEFSRVALIVKAEDKQKLVDEQPSAANVQPDIQDIGKKLYLQEFKKYAEKIRVGAEED